MEDYISPIGDSQRQDKSDHQPKKALFLKQKSGSFRQKFEKVSLFFFKRGKKRGENGGKA